VAAVYTYGAMVVGRRWKIESMHVLNGSYVCGRESEPTMRRYPALHYSLLHWPGCLLCAGTLAGGSTCLYIYQYHRWR
jgi:hypothetical protein